MFSRNKLYILLFLTAVRLLHCADHTVSVASVQSHTFVYSSSDCNRIHEINKCEVELTVMGVTNV